jgi:hypothetical protein
LRALGRIKTHEGAIKALKRRCPWPISVEQFRKWKRLGNDTLYVTNKALIPKIQEAINKLRLLAQTPQKAKATGISSQLAREQAKNAELRQTIEKLTENLIQKGFDWDAERTLRIHYEQRLAELGQAQHKLSTPTKLKSSPDSQLRKSAINAPRRSAKKNPSANNTVD